MLCIQNASFQAKLIIGSQLIFLNFILLDPKIKLYSIREVLNLAKLNFILQGLDENKNHYKEVLRLFETSEPNKFILSTAFLRSKAVALLSNKLSMNKEIVDFYVGIGNNVTSFQSLKALLDIGITPYVVDTGCSDLIFHPKVYLAISTKNNYAKTISGSANFTPRGLVGNIEGSTIAELNLSLTEDAQYLDNILESFEFLKNEYKNNVFKISSEDEIRKLLNQNRLLDESKTSNKHEEDSTTVGEIEDNTQHGSACKIPRIKLKVQKVTFPSITTTGTPTVSVGTPATTTITPAIAIVTPAVTTRTLLWESDILTNRDLNIKVIPNTHVTGSINLDAGKNGIPNFQTYFRNTVFSGLTWRHSNALYPYIEYASAQFELIILGHSYGTFTLELTHNTNLNSKTALQKNALTHLKWGAIKRFVSNSRYVGSTTLKIYKDITSTNFILDIS